MTDQTGIPDRSDRSEQPVIPVESNAESTAEATAVVSTSRVDEVPSAPPTKEDEDLVDYDASPERNLEINVVHMCSDYFVVSEEEVAQSFERSLHEGAC